MQVTMKVRRLPDGTYEATSPNVPGCVTRAASPKEALEKHRLAVRPHLAETTDIPPECLEFHETRDEVENPAAQSAPKG